MAGGYFAGLASEGLRQILTTGGITDPLGVIFSGGVGLATGGFFGAVGFGIGKILNSIKGAISSSEPAKRILGQLSSTGGNSWKSSAGLRYGPDPNHGNRVQHLLRHVDDIPTQPGKFGVFNVGRSGILELIDEAWLIAKGGGPRVQIKPQGIRTVYRVDMERIIGFIGGQEGSALGNPSTNFIRLVIEGINDLITAFPD